MYFLSKHHSCANVRFIAHDVHHMYTGNGEYVAAALRLKCTFRYGQVLSGMSPVAVLLSS